MDIDADGLPDGPRCPVCSGPLDAEPFAAEGRVSVAYTCPTHGVSGIVADPFASDADGLPD
jgi:hypothetical protein